MGWVAHPCPCNTRRPPPHPQSTNIRKYTHHHPGSMVWMDVREDLRHRYGEGKEVPKLLVWSRPVREGCKYEYLHSRGGGEAREGTRNRYLLVRTCAVPGPVQGLPSPLSGSVPRSILFHMDDLRRSEAGKKSSKPRVPSKAQTSTKHQAQKTHLPSTGAQQRERASERGLTDVRDC